MVERKTEPCLLSMPRASKSLPSSRSRLKSPNHSITSGPKLMSSRLTTQTYHKINTTHNQQVQDTNSDGLLKKDGQGRVKHCEPSCDNKFQVTRQVNNPTSGAELSDLGYRLFFALNILSYLKTHELKTKCTVWRILDMEPVSPVAAWNSSHRAVEAKSLHRTYVAEAKR